MNLAGVLVVEIRLIKMEKYTEGLVSLELHHSSYTSLGPPARRMIRDTAKSLNWPKTIFLVGIPLVALFSLRWVPLRRETVWTGVIYAYLRALTVTAGKKHCGSRLNVVIESML